MPSMGLIVSVVTLHGGQNQLSQEKLNIYPYVNGIPHTNGAR